MTGRRWACALAVLVALGAGGAQAATPEAERQARHSFERAEAHFKSGLFAEALAEYRAGYEQLPLPGFLINIAQCHRRLGDLVQARTTYQKFIMVAPDSPYVDDVKLLIVELDRLIDASEAGAEADPGNAAAGEANAASPASPTVDHSAPTAASPAEQTRADLATAPELPPPPPQTRTRWWLWAGIGAAVVAGAVVSALLLRSPQTTTLHDGSLGTLRR
jgi:tetratricopeptide (TPR) repeat protein